MEFVYDIRLNHVGFPTRAKKVFVLEGEAAECFEVQRMVNGCLTPVLRATLTRDADGKLIGDFSSIVREGVYKIAVGDRLSRTFYVYDAVYDSVCRTMTQYFEWQRCGDDCGYNPNCHLGDKIVDKNGVIHPLAGGHHQSGDLRKWSFGCPAGIFGLSEYLDEFRPLWNKGRLEYEIEHSLKHYLNRISPDGYVFDSTFVPTYYDDAECRGKGYPTEVAFWDDFLYFDEPTDPHGHCLVIKMLASASRSLRQTNPARAKEALQGAMRVWEYMHRVGQYETSHEWRIYPPIGHDTFKELLFDFYYPDSAIMLADLCSAEVELYRAAPDEGLKEIILDRLKKLCSLEILTPDGAHDRFRLSTDSTRFAEEVKYFPVSIPLTFAKAYDLFSEDPDAAFLLPRIEAFVKFYEKQAAGNAYGKTTTHLACENARLVWDYFGASYVFDHAETVLFLTVASRYVCREACLTMAQRLLDYIVGANPQDISCIEGVGFNQLPFAVFGEFFPPLPKIPGAVITDFDPEFETGIYGREYDMPIVGMLLLAFARYQRECREPQTSS